MMTKGVVCGNHLYVSNVVQHAVDCFGFVVTIFTF